MNKIKVRFCKVCYKKITFNLDQIGSRNKTAEGSGVFQEWSSDEGVMWNLSKKSIIAIPFCNSCFKQLRKNGKKVQT